MIYVKLEKEVTEAYLVTAEVSTDIYWYLTIATIIHATNMSNVFNRRFEM